LGLELDKESVSVLALGGKGDLPIVAELLQGLSIPTLVLMDKDPGDVTTQACLRSSIRLPK
jgi:predicted ATP-dependent endonuclease of OLD family